MLSNPDRRIVAQDRNLPGLALLLDEHHALSLFRTAWPQHRLQRLATTYLRYKPGVRCLAGYLGHTRDGPMLWHAKAYTADEYTNVRDAAARASSDGSASAPALLDDQCIAAWHFPTDRKLVGLSDLASAEPRARWLREQLPDKTALWRARLETLRYKPERRYVGKLTTGVRDEALAKVYDQRDFENAWRAAKTIQTWTVREPLIVARPLGRSKRRRFIVSQWLAGEPLSELLLGADCSADRLCEIGAALAEFHRQVPDHLERVAREHEAMAVLAAANAAAWLCPDLAPRLRRLAPRIAAELLAAPAEQRPIHGDFSADQILVAAHGIGIIDYDRTRVGDPAADFGTFIAQLERNEVCGTLPVGRAGEVAEALNDGYCRQARCAQPSKTDLYVAAGLLRLAPHGFRNRLVDWPVHIEHLLQRAERFFRVYSRNEQIAIPIGAGERFGA
ncbi:aminoglycoside phosphotransferase family protein [Thioalkalicoccus limnaeus]|uniref:Aminoglycoside phosphotransferase family protein n=1 Tax=Thioalkalicoccus limnaeus TaxID=120681 RepID=A0ABV4BD63_9GAMM